LDTTLVISPLFASDHTLVAVSSDISVSLDSGRTFHLLPANPLGDAQVLEVLVHGGKARMVAAFGPNPDLAGKMAYSDDLGASWRPAVLPGGVGGVQIVRALGDDHLIAAALVVERDRLSEFICSADGGAVWNRCSG
jgi:hypothetical protein